VSVKRDHKETCEGAKETYGECYLAGADVSCRNLAVRLSLKVRDEWGTGIQVKVRDELGTGIQVKVRDEWGTGIQGYRSLSGKFYCSGNGLRYKGRHGCLEKINNRITHFLMV
jgi:hypothetical protein